METAKRKRVAKKFKIVRGYTIKYHANGCSVWSKGKIRDGKPDGYWEWYRLDGTLKRSGTFKDGEKSGRWTTYDKQGKAYKVTRIK
jgi:antitoxin component YwqK of YwqJK toxin-antitoxin module